MRFEMFTKHEVQLFALHINFLNLNEFFLSICMQHTDKNVPRKCVFLGAFFSTVYCRIAGASGGFASWTPTKALPWTHWGTYTAPRLPATPGNEIRSLHIVLSAGYHFHPCPHDKFGPPFFLNSLKKGLASAILFVVITLRIII